MLRLVKSTVSSSTGVALIELASPKSLNALTVSMGSEFKEVVAGLASDPSVSAVVLAGEGRAFSAGGDLAWLDERRSAGGVANSATMMEFYKSFLCVRNIPVPVIGAVHGPAVGAGACLALATDIRVIHADASLAFNFVRLGLHPGMAATHFLPAAVGPQAAARLLTTGETVKGGDAVAMGLGAELVTEEPARESTLAAAMQLAESIASNCGSEAVRAVTRTLRSGLEEGLEAHMLRDADSQAHSYASEEFGKRLGAVIERTRSRK